LRCHGARRSVPLAMPSKNVELVRKAFDAWNDGSVEGLVGFTTEGIEWLEVEGRPESPGEALPGRERLRAGLESLFESWEHYRLEPEEVRDVDDDRVFALLREVARGRASGVEVTSRWGYVITVRDGKLARVEAYRNPAAAREAVGLSE
jgi:ketosteroid isomerase-like protein